MVLKYIKMIKIIKIHLSLCEVHMEGYRISATTVCIQQAQSDSWFCTLPIWILWRIWKSRNMLIFQHKHIPWPQTLQNARSDHTEYRDIVSLRESQMAT
ncbi:unnamed protein product, partial [Thlaspi arvense]